MPLVIPEVNPEHLGLIPIQRRNRKSTGYIVTNANCTTMFLAMALGPIHKAFTIEKVFMVSMQAVSGAGYPGVPSLDILGNVIPFIGGEEEKVEIETRKILGTFNGQDNRSGWIHGQRPMQSCCRRGRTHGIRFDKVGSKDNGSGNRRFVAQLFRRAATTPSCQAPRNSLLS